MKLHADIYRKILRVGLKLYLHAFLDLKYFQEEEFPEGPKVFAVNHPTVWDAFPILTYDKNERIHTLVEEQIWSFALPRLIFTFSNQVKLYRDDKSSESVADSLFLLSQGRSVLIAPEGERTSPSETVRAKRGAARLAIEGRVPIVPVGVWIDEQNIVMKPVAYSYQGRDYTVESYFPKFRAHYGVAFGKPIYVDDFHDREPDLNQYQSISTDILERIYALSQRAKRLFSIN